MHLREQRGVVVRLLLRARVDGRGGAAAAGVHLQAGEVHERLRPHRPAHVRGRTVEQRLGALGVTGRPGIQRGVDGARGSGLARCPRGVSRLACSARSAAVPGAPREATT